MHTLALWHLINSQAEKCQSLSATTTPRINTILQSTKTKNITPPKIQYEQNIIIKYQIIFSRWSLKFGMFVQQKTPSKPVIQTCHSQRYLSKTSRSILATCSALLPASVVTVSQTILFPKHHKQRLFSYNCESTKQPKQTYLLRHSTSIQASSGVLSPCVLS